jgi:hypothetical protein
MPSIRACCLYVFVVSFLVYFDVKKLCVREKNAQHRGMFPQCFCCVFPSFINVNKLYMGERNNPSIGACFICIFVVSFIVYVDVIKLCV